MVKRLHCLFIMSLLGTACMTGSESNIATEKPKEIKGNTIPKAEQRHVSKKKINPPTITLKKDITKHPFLWVGVSIWSMVSFLLVKRFMFWLGYESKLDSSLDVLKNNSIYTVLAFLLSVGVHAVISILLASWIGKKQKENGVVIHSFKVRLWHSVRFIYPSIIVIYFALFLNAFLRGYIGVDLDIVYMLLTFSPYIMSTFTYLRIVSYDDWKKGQKALPTITLKKDITKHPFLWVGVSIWSIFSFLLVQRLMFCLGYEFEFSSSLDILKNNSIYTVLSFLLSVGIHAVISILLASWIGKKQKENGVVIHSFKVRLWHSVRFIYPPIIVIYFGLFLNALRVYIKYYNDIVNMLLTFSPYIMSTFTYLGIVSCDNWKQGKKEDREATNKKDPVLSQKGESLASTKPLVA